MNLPACLVIYYSIFQLCSPVVLFSQLATETYTSANFRTDLIVSAPQTISDEIMFRNKTPNLKITTMSKVIGGMPGMEGPEVKICMEFAIAPMKGLTPMLDKAIIAWSDKYGNFEVNLSPGKYWIGSKKKVENPEGYQPGTTLIQDMIVEVTDGRIVSIDLLRTSYAP